jgi:hypothetical protein
VFFIEDEIGLALIFAAIIAPMHTNGGNRDFIRIDDDCFLRQR